MFTSLDFIVIVFMTLAALSLIALILMFAAKSPKFKRVSLYTASVLGVISGYIAFQIGWPYFVGHALLGVLVALASILAVIIERTGKKKANAYKTARIIAAAALVIGIINAIS